ncbi:MAG: bifunctional methylenetetrahydrofolate dehydrogenase/methenyltetrahydrofolate cyclohydrolase FolD [Candidatus Saganbacteria bacterium]|nr:bifunctional methylenetetrahydrofolate dehydrogenase/methenyltetrahydrofolate cyclohydrolase FolD [Candidatus Saganbacteria bacterium]
MAQIIDGKLRAAKIKEELKIRVQALSGKGVVPKLAVLLIGDNPASKTYVSSKAKTCEELGMFSEVHHLPENVREEIVIDLLKGLNADTNIFGLMVQLPVPKHLNERKLLDIISPHKDVDGLCTVTAGKLIVGGEKGFVPCTPQGIMDLILSTGIELKGKRAVVVGRSNIVGKPVAFLLLEQHATVTIAHSRTADLGAVCREADVLVVAVGVPRLITGEMVKPGAVVIDVGTTKIEGRLVGDVDFEGASKVAGFITPVPGGVGPMTIAMLMKNTVLAAEAHLTRK